VVILLVSPGAAFDLLDGVIPPLLCLLTNTLIDNVTDNPSNASPHQRNFH
jgi:hypothetical protein